MITEDDFKALVTLIEDGELDDRMIDLIGAVNERNERRKHEIEKLVQSVWGPGAQIVGGAPGAPLPPSAPSVPEGFYLGQDGNLYPMGNQNVSPGEPPPVAQVVAPVGKPWPTPIPATVEDGPVTLGVQPVRDSMGGNFGDGDPDIVSTGAQIQRYTP